MMGCRFMNRKIGTNDLLQPLDVKSCSLSYFFQVTLTRFSGEEKEPSGRLKTKKESA